MASLNSAGKQPVVSDLLINKAIMGESSPPNKPRGCWIELACLIRRKADQFRDLVDGDSGEVVTRRGTSYSGVAAVDARSALSQRGLSQMKGGC